MEVQEHTNLEHTSPTTAELQTGTLQTSEQISIFEGEEINESKPIENEHKVFEIKKLYYSIGEISQLLGVASHVLRYWESEFTQLQPKKSRKGNRLYQEKDLQLLLQIKTLLYEKKYTVAGAKKYLTNKNGDSAENSQNLLSEVRDELHEILKLIDSNSGRGAAR